MSFAQKLEQYRQSGQLPDKTATLMQRFYQSYMEGIRSCGLDPAAFEGKQIGFLELVVKQVTNPHPFENFHRHVTAPIDYYSFGIELFRPMVNEEASRVKGEEQLAQMRRQIAAKENVVLLANHQTELDPQVISMLLENSYPEIGKEMIFVAGDRVLSDPMAVPFSLGRNLLCIYSKRHIDHPPERKEEKLRYNQKTMQAMERLLSEGGQCIYIAPAGGRDRPNAEGVFEVAPFDPQSLEMLFLTARKAERPTHFYPLALRSAALLPPPSTVTVGELGEWRKTTFTPLYGAFGAEIDLEQFPGNDLKDKKERRQARAEYIHSLVKREYDSLA
jgi:glycerol-3-phosphate O-acyltransferase